MVNSFPATILLEKFFAVRKFRYVEYFEHGFFSEWPSNSY
jgi:hypothetical protein